MEPTRLELAIALYIAVSLVQQLLAALSGGRDYLIRGGALVIALSAAVGGGDGAVTVLVWWVACWVINSLVSAYQEV